MHPLPRKLLAEEAVLAVAQTADRFAVRRIVGRALRKRDAARCQEAAHAVIAWLAVDEMQVIALGVEGLEGPAVVLGMGFEILVEQPLPR